ncbi:preprotein translocase subunit SecE [Caloramator quimbayensis]|uniref:Protein translocase subunit SecE n=1 Tax=Caloramator quimbayensis TaxID=1147123 RepID=A0A1T4YDW9_9CLOT|nr:preprotein translocase subunit SecE [Caloramator quimbayensis]SKA99976.1 preprotein translocase subunit SecE [Caloramator quimbayensis]
MSANTNVSNASKNVSSVSRFYKEVRAEFKKITWPSKDNVIKTTEVVFITLAIFVVIIWLYDSVFGLALKSILNYLK